MIKAIYGKFKFNKHTCPNCRNSLLNKTRSFICDVCGYQEKEEKAKKFKVIVPPPGIRKRPPMVIQKIILEIQSNKCYWCGNKFETAYWKNDKLRFLKIQWDHKIPFSYTKTNRNDNWVASCNVCNSFKSNFMFKTDKECRNFLLRKWQIALDKEEISINEIEEAL